MTGLPQARAIVVRHNWSTIYRDACTVMVGDPRSLPLPDALAHALERAVDHYVSERWQRIRETEGGQAPDRWLASEDAERFAARLRAELDTPERVALRTRLIEAGCTFSWIVAREINQFEAPSCARCA